MRHGNAQNELQVVIDTHECSLPQAETERMLAALDTLDRKAEKFPIRDLRIVVERKARTSEFTVKTSLILPGQTLVASDHNTVVYTAYERCLDNLMRELESYLSKMGQVPERQGQEQGTSQDLHPDHLPDGRAIDAAIGEGDYAAFRVATLSYEEPLRKRAGRWVERYPEAAGQIGTRLTMADVVEAVFLDAFEGYEARPREVRLGDWLDSLIDPAVRTLLSQGEGELENIRMARSARGVAASREET